VHFADLRRGVTVLRARERREPAFELVEFHAATLARRAPRQLFAAAPHQAMATARTASAITAAAIDAGSERRA